MMKVEGDSKALEEILEIKDILYEEDKNCSILESLKRAHEITQKLIVEKKLKIRWE